MFSASIFAGRQISLQFRTEELPPNRRFFCVGRNDLAMRKRVKLSVLVDNLLALPQSAQTGEPNLPSILRQDGLAREGNSFMRIFTLLSQFHENFVYVVQLFPGVGDWWKDLRFTVLRFHISCGPVSQGISRFPSLDKVHNERRMRVHPDFVAFLEDAMNNANLGILLQKFAMLRCN